ncbi:MAG: AAA family ATPase [Bacilli bacterium]|nr:AAA family ATPase [Bacilli bacterium]
MYRESEIVELKQELNKNIKKEIVAFANSKGGTIYIGINDDGNVIGLKNINEDVEALSGMIREGIIGNLTLYTSIDTKFIENKNIIELHITSGPKKPYYLADKGLKPNGVYLRHGSSSIQATDEIIRKMLVESSYQKYEDEICKNQDLTFNYTKDFFKNKNIDFSKNKYNSLKMLTGENYNNLALLLSDQNPFTIKCAIFEGKDKTIFKDRKELKGSSIKIIEDAFYYMNLSNHIESNFEGLQRIDKKDYPDFALRESLLNAVIHRDYYFDGSILLSIFDDRIEINSIGGLINNLTLEDIYSGVSNSRNPNFAEIFHRLNYVENYGTGIGRIIKEYKDNEKKPIIELSENVFKIILPNRNYKEKNITKINKNLSKEENIIEFLKVNDRMTRADVESLLNIGNTRSKQIINNMLEKDIILKKGTGKNTYYMLK